jgi:hypothetical protein
MCHGSLMITMNKTTVNIIHNKNGLGCGHNRRNRKKSGSILGNVTNGNVPLVRCSAPYETKISLHLRGKINLTQ